MTDFTCGKFILPIRLCGLIIEIVRRVLTIQISNTGILVKFYGWSTMILSMDPKTTRAAWFWIGRMARKCKFWFDSIGTLQQKQHQTTLVRQRTLKKVLAETKTQHFIFVLEKPMCFFISHNGAYRCQRRLSDGIAIDHGFLGY